jgi:cytochrome b involved in lipid metabolism
MSKVLLSILCTFGFLLASCSLIPQKSTVAMPNLPPSEAQEAIKTPIEADKTEQTILSKSYTATEVATHANSESCWLILDKKIYDVTSFIGKHPGGESILRGCWKDATQMFSRHPESAKAMKEQFYIGDLK